MKRIIDNLSTSAWVLKKICRLKYNSELKRKILKTWIEVFCLNRIDERNKTAQFMGFKIKYADQKTLEFMFKEIFVKGEYYFKSSKDSPVIIDCGSNIGISLIFFKSIYPKCEIISFEPSKEVFSCLKENVESNKFASVKMYNQALSGTEGTIPFYFDAFNPGDLRMSTNFQRMPKERRIVKSVLLSKTITREVDFLKIDIEGSELEVLNELYESGRIRSVKQMAIEYHHHIDTNTDKLSSILVILETAGFGYQIHSRLGRPFARGQFQDILIYAYRKKN